MDEPPKLGKSEIYILVSIFTVIGAIFMKLPKLPWWLVALGSLAGGLASFFAFESHTFGDFLLGSAAGALAPYGFGVVLDTGRKFLAKKAGVAPQAAVEEVKSNDPS